MQTNPNKKLDPTLVLDRTTADFYLLEGLNQEIILEEVGEYFDLNPREMRRALPE